MAMSQPPLAELTLEQQFSLRSFEAQVDKMSREQAQQFLVKLYEQMLCQETVYRQLIKHNWGIAAPISFDAKGYPPIGELD
jgi:hypothetical protein